MYPFSNNSYQIPMPFDNLDVNLRQTFNSEINPSSQFEETQANYLLNSYSPSIQYKDEVKEQTWLQIQDVFFKLQSITTDDKTARNMGETKRASSNELRSESIRKKDRHTKINTTHGMRDRRMRLSLDVARKFFDLHDFLGFDKASKTVEWLLINCNPAIKEIKRGMRHGESSHEIDESSTNEYQQPSISKNVKKMSHFKKEKKAKVHLIGQESRKIAREKARKRTIEKRKVSESKDIDCDFNGLEEFRAQEKQLLGEQPHDAAGDSFLIRGNWNTSDVCFWQENEDIYHENHLVDFLIGEKAWGDYNN